MNLQRLRINRILPLLLVLLILATGVFAQSSSRNYVQTKTFLDAGGSTFLRHIDYYDELGYVSLNANGTPTGWNYYVTDHLGSTRMVVGSDNSIKETVNYYPFGSEMRMQSPAQMASDFWQPFRFTGKELDRQYGLNLYDFGARLYDVASVPMWTSVDPLAEKYYNISPYAYCAGDPVNKFDPDGRSVWTKGAKLLWKVGSEVAKNGLKALSTADTYVSAFADVKESVNTLTDANASISDKVIAGATLASEALPISMGDIKDGQKLASRALNSLSRKEINNARRSAVRNAWKQEKELVKTTGKGTRDWNKSETEELMVKGKVSGYVGHHINNVKDHPEMAKDPNNVAFVKGKWEHLIRHNGNYRNKTEGEFIYRE